MIKIFRASGLVDVQVTIEDIQAFNRRWPDIALPVQPLTFTFDVRCNLVSVLPNPGALPGLMTLSHEAELLICP